ncbi:hypothetical protein [Actinomadura bangladeshensis]|nr:hypothetical protein [Actinomadura bangladeshensis]
MIDLLRRISAVRWSLMSRGVSGHVSATVGNVIATGRFLWSSVWLPLRG